ncbi:MAG: ABC transporter substrate-binding protein [Gemmatimonadetes bacterium]|nr:ABC transporter substrate-binding protein [Gemmatimonadota bacterium]
MKALRLPLALLGALLGACATPQAAPARLVAIDDAGDTVRLAAPATRVVSLSPATTELVFALGAGGHLVGRTRWCDYPDAARAVPSVGDGIPPNIEAVLATRPDLVLLYRSAQNSAAAERLRAAGIAVVQLDFNRLHDVSRLARLLAPLLGVAPAGDSLATAFEAELAGVAREAPAGCGADSFACPRVLLLAWDQPPIAIGAGSFQGEILEAAGGRNIFADLTAPSATVSIEAIAARDPALVLVGDSEPAVAGRPEWQVVGAVRGRRFVHFNPPAFGRPSPRAPGVIRDLRQALREARP